MNQGNFLDSLLNTKAVSPAAGKNQAAKTRTDVSDKFRDTFTQVRPPVAAVKAAAHTGSAERSNIRTSEPSNKVTARDSSTREPDHHNVRRRQMAEPKENPVHQNDSRDQKLAREDSAPLKRASAQSASTETEPQAQGATEAANAVAVESAAQVDPSITAEPVLTELPGLSLIASTQGAPDSNIAALISVSSSEPTGDELPTDALLLTPISPAATISATAEIDGEETLAVFPQPVLAAAQGDSQMKVANPLAFNNTQPASADSEAVDLNVEMGGDAPGVEDNPDFLLLNAKAATARSLDTKVTAEPVDLAKPTTASALTEPVARLAEAQSPAARSFVVQTGVPVAVGQPQWSQAVGEKVLWLAAQNVSAAEIRLDPPDMGQLHVKVSVNQEQATVSFISPHPAVRDALDQQLNRLREMFSEQGLNLVNVDVSDRSNRQEQGGDEHQHARRNSELDEEELAPVATSVITATRLVDHYA